MNEKPKKVIEMIESQVNLDKSQVREISQEIINKFDSGDIDPFIYAGKIEFMLQVLETAMSDIRTKLVSEIDVYGRDAENGIIRNGIQFKRKEAGVKYDFSANKPWQDKKEQIDSIKNEMKDVESFLKTLTKKMIHVDEQTGEMIELTPPIKSSKTIIEITIPKA